MLHYQCVGSGKQTLVLVHGFCENNTCFNEQVLFFKDHCKLLVVDLPGFGKSEPMANISMDKMASEIKLVLDAENIHACIMLGHSMGGYVTLAFVEQFPNYIEGFGLIHSVANADSEERKEKRLQVISFIEKHGKEPYIKNFIPTLFKEPAKKSNIEEAVLQGLTSNQTGIIEAAKAMMNRPDRTPILANSHKPVFFAVGKFDALIPEALMLEQAALCNLSHIAYLQNSGHMGMQEEPLWLNQEINKFLKLVAHASN
ncbi:MAG: alpha/beta hydrolase [bacterium]|nr:alpha/beta hydrolase [bacterium]